MVPYLHHTQGRIRIRSEFIQKNPVLIKQHIQYISKLKGIREVLHRQRCGSVTILFDHHQVKDSHLLKKTEQFGWINADKQPDTINQTIQNGAKKAIKGIVLGSVKRSFGAPVAMVVAAAMGK
ncbi:HMA2 domain-containing protein [Neisseria sp. Ec49-e6-T10]|uniref:HMA2 domain-containing protein n=1 Tax=Neisseria sp. Ec49-e6-T10 TaxID=3140744 RepID=UPI003EC00B72